MTHSTELEGPTNPNLEEWATDTAAAEVGGWRNPPLAVRIFLVGAVCAMPGLLAGLMVNLLLGFTDDSAIAAIAGATLFAIIGGRMEAVE